MEFHEKLQILRKERGMTQEELAELLFVSRTAVSKWESGRGFPNIDSLKAISGFFKVSIDDLLSNNELLFMVTREQQETAHNYRNLLFGILDSMALLLAIIPMFSQPGGSAAAPVSLFALVPSALWIRIVYLLLWCGTLGLGFTELIFSGLLSAVRIQYLHAASLCLSAAAVLVFMLGRHIYAGAFLFVLLLAKIAVLFRAKH